MSRSAADKSAAMKKKDDDAGRTRPTHYSNDINIEDEMDGQPL